MLEEYVIEEYIQESIDSITMKHNQIKLKDLDRILRKTLPRPAAYNLRRSLQTMIKSDYFEGHLDGSTFVRTPPKKKQVFKKLDDKDIKSVKSTLMDLLRGTDSISVSKLERETGVDRVLLRRTLIILLGEGIIQGTFEGDLFVLDERMNSHFFAEKLIEEMRVLAG